MPHKQQCKSSITDLTSTEGYYTQLADDDQTSRNCVVAVNNQKSHNCVVAVDDQKSHNCVVAIDHYDDDDDNFQACPLVASAPYHDDHDPEDNRLHSVVEPSSVQHGYYK